MLESSFWQGLMSVDRNDVSIPDVLCDSHDDMGESEVQKISSAITAVFPDLPVAVLNSVIDTLKALGAETTDDLQHITEGDLLPVLRPIQARRLIVSWGQNSKSVNVVFRYSNSNLSVSLSRFYMFHTNCCLSLNSLNHIYLIVPRRQYLFSARLGRQFPNTMAEAP
ncbi:hypothetical protein NFI96_015285 [Prochilodus magdalenae]|nr:hypothetical protein NFI96_015285 [Prochilodus magdalenae]